MTTLKFMVIMDLLHINMQKNMDVSLLFLMNVYNIILCHIRLQQAAKQQDYPMEVIVLSVMKSLKNLLLSLNWVTQQVCGECGRMLHMKRRA